MDVDQVVMLGRMMLQEVIHPCWAHSCRRNSASAWW